MNETIGYISSALIGVSLGLIGGGGSILTVPVMVYLFHLSPLTATSYSLFIVGSTSFIGAIANYRRNQVHLPTALLFGAASVVTVFAVRKFIIPIIPLEIAKIGSFEIHFSFLTMIVFSLLMLLAAISMIGNKVVRKKAEHSTVRMLLYGIGIGLVTGFLGAGGGFLLIPALVLLIGLEMKKAVGTSLLIIAVNSLVGFVGDAGHYSIDWSFLLLITAIAITGIFIGGLVSRYVNSSHLKKSFGWFVLVMAIYILVKEITGQSFG
ncbi:MAG: sulfite exporter TauE/SafE family protein [Chitinophagaceae bacterium]|nr:MAG: sulfite exporter TauE/SafE family protein [Chitinophagaceae bacterium]